MHTFILIGLIIGILLPILRGLSSLAEAVREG